MSTTGPATSATSALAGPGRNLLGVHALVWVPDWTPASARRAIEATASAGFDLIEIPVLDPAEIDPHSTRAQLADAGLTAASSLGLTFDTDVSSPDPAVMARGRDALARALDVAADLGARHLCGVLYSALGKYPGPVTDVGRGHAAETMAWLVDRATGSGVTVSLEVVNRYESNLANTAADMAAFIDATGADIGLHLDTYHMNIEENGFADPVRTAGRRLRYVHVGESHRGYLGTGTVDFAEFFAALAAADYSGPITFESFSSAIVHPTLSSTLAVWRDLWNDSADLAGHARRFLATHLGMRQSPAQAAR